jgi:hypothetical protein
VPICRTPDREIVPSAELQKITHHLSCFGTRCAGGQIFLRNGIQSAAEFGQFSVSRLKRAAI